MVSEALTVACYRRSGLFARLPMLIVCPTCSTSYMIDPASLGPAGRTVRCARCRTSWFAGGDLNAAQDSTVDVLADAESTVSADAATTAAEHDRPASAPDSDAGFPAAAAAERDSAAATADIIAPEDSPPLVPQIDEAIAPPQVEEDVRDTGGFAARRARLQARRKTKRRSSKWTAIILVLLGLNVAFVGARSEVVRYLPQTASLFAAIGLPVNLRHLSFEDVRITKQDQDGVPILTVSGTIVSRSNTVVEVPPLRFAIRNATGQEIYAWTNRPDRKTLDAGDKLPFHTRLASPPPDSSDVVVRFANADEAAMMDTDSNSAKTR
jgi:predicted Zn finger-like uncharacterized protein